MEYSHISNIAFKANRSLGLVKRSLHMCQQDANALAYTSLVKSYLEYAWSTWDPHTDSNKYKLEAVQHRVARFVTRNYNWKIPGTSIVQELGWKTLEQRRRKHSLELMIKVVNGQSGVNMSDYCNETTKRITRHEKCYVPPQCRTDIYQQSYFPRTLREWNVLPPELVDSCNLDSFSAGLARYLYDWALGHSIGPDGAVLLCRVNNWKFE